MDKTYHVGKIGKKGNNACDKNFFHQRILDNICQYAAISCLYPINSYITYNLDTFLQSFSTVEELYCLVEQ